MALLSLKTYVPGGQFTVDMFDLARLSSAAIGSCLGTAFRVRSLSLHAATRKRHQHSFDRVWHCMAVQHALWSYHSECARIFCSLTLLVCKIAYQSSSYSFLSSSIILLAAHFVPYRTSFNAEWRMEKGRQMEVGGTFDT